MGREKDTARALREAQINRMKIRSNENSKLEMYISIYMYAKADFQLNDGRILTVVTVDETWCLSMR
jgi:hypothetical protein